MLKNKVIIKKSLFYSLIVGIFILGLMTINSKITLNNFVNEHSTNLDYLIDRIDELELKYDELNDKYLSMNLGEIIFEEDSEEVEETNDNVIVNIEEEILDNEDEVSVISIEEEFFQAKNNEDDIETIVDKIEETNNEEINLVNINQKSGLSEEQFNQLIEVAMNNKNKNTSSLLNMGAYLKFIEDEYNVNGLFALSVSSFESGWGVRFTNNNLFGFKSGALEFKNVGESINYFGKLIRNNYMNEGRDTVSAISTKYCPPNSNKWSSDVNWFMRYYADTANLILNPQE